MPNKTLKFRPHLVEMILAGTKTTTWRLWDDKDLSKGDRVDVLNSETKEFAISIELVSLHDTKFGALTDDDRAGHETYGSEDEMYAEFQRYYEKEVNADTPLRVIKFRTLES